DIPSLANQEAGLLCNLQIKINNIIEGELDEEMEALLTGTEIKNEVIEGQGTTAMTYPRWNFRWKLSKAYGKRRITAKKNVASSMQSHKMGATRLYNYLYSEIIGKNEVGGKVAVLQYPVFGFKKSLIDGTTNQYIYTPIGLYTIGADKGDKHTFGYDNAQYENSIIHLEGADHTPKSVGFDYPYEATKFSSSAEAMGAINTDGTVIGAWEVGMAGKLENNVKADEEGVQEMLNAEWMPAYNVAYHNSPYVMGVSETIASINANVDEWRKGKTADGKSFTLFEIYNASDYALHYYDIQTKQYKPTGVNVLTDVGLTASAVSGMSLAEIDAKIIELRKARFVAEWGTYFHTDDAILHYTFCLIFGVTDNFKKNTYPYKFPFLANGGKWRWRVDDLDTLFDVINQGLATKQPDILVGDTDATGSIYVGDTSVLWTLIKETQGNEIKAMAHKIFSAMVSHPLAEGANTQAKLVGCIKHFFWDFAQNYFPASAYNVDAEWTYEDTWANKNSWKEVNPLSQALSGHFEAEKDWVTMRMLFMSSYFNFGAFTHTGYNDASTGQMVYGGADAHTFEITPAVSINPTIIRGSTETITYGDRVKANETVPLTVSDASGDDTRIYLQGLDYIKDLGDLKDLKVSAKNPTLSVASKRLQSLKVGDADASKVPTSGTISNLSFGDCPSLMVIDAQNLGTLVGAVDLSLLPRLKEALFSGTNVKTIGLPSGSKIERFQIPDSLTALDMQNLKFLNEEGFEYGTLGNIEFFRIENCDNIDKFALLKSMYLADGSKLKNIRVVGFNYEGNADDVTMVANMAIDKDKDGNEHFYNGINQEGQIDEEMLPVIEGRLKVNGSIYEDDGKILKQYYPNLTLEVTGGYYVKFADAEVQRICADNWGNGVGITKAQVESVTTFAYTFQGSTIKNFDDAYKFNNVTKLEASGGGYGGAFNRCTSLTSITLPTSITEIQSGAPTYGGGDGAFFEATSLVRCLGLGNVSYFGACSFYKCPSLTEVDIDWNKVTYIGEAAFTQCKINVDKLAIPKLETLGGNSLQGIQTKVVADLGKITSLPYHWYSKLFCDNVECVVLPDTLTSMDTHSIHMDSSFNTLVMKAVTPPTIQSNTFMQLPSSAVFYVPDASVEAYKGATNWSDYASRIKGISELPTDNAELYNEIKDYLS
ncbi:MAG: leucine-rich repeat domain-containing protein, partial [Bacteroidales bacterium]|nr:leucine-rich repeat domain-containing protein [Bacteroidales bacterium]